MSTPRNSRRNSAPAINPPTVIEFLLDETGSMDRHKAGTLSGFNVFLDEQRAQGGTCLLSLTKFDTSGLKTPYTDIDVKLAPPLTEATFLPNSGTNLRDTIGRRVRDLDTRLSGFTVQPPVLVVVLTDGEDNASREYSEPQIRALIRAHEARGWTFVYLGANRNALATAERLGFQPGNAKQFDMSRIHETFSDLSRSTTAFRATGQFAA